MQEWAQGEKYHSGVCFRLMEQEGWNGNERDILKGCFFFVQISFCKEKGEEDEDLWLFLEFHQNHQNSQKGMNIHDSFGIFTEEDEIIMILEEMIGKEWNLFFDRLIWFIDIPDRQEWRLSPH